MNLGDLDSIGDLMYSVSQNAYYYINGKGEFQQFSPSGSVTLPYTEYTVTLAQSGEAAPTATVWSNSKGASITIGRTSAGIYTLTATSGIFTAGTFSYFFGNCSNASINRFTFERTSDTVITLTTSAGLSATDFGGNLFLTLKFYA